MKPSVSKFGQVLFSKNGGKLEFAGSELAILFGGYSCLLPGPFPPDSDNSGVAPPPSPGLPVPSGCLSGLRAEEGCAVGVPPNPSSLGTLWGPGPPHDGTGLHCGLWEVYFREVACLPFITLLLLRARKNFSWTN